MDGSGSTYEKTAIRITFTTGVDIPATSHNNTVYQFTFPIGTITSESLCNVQYIYIYIYTLDAYIKYIYIGDSRNIS